MTRDELLDALEAGALVATGNARLSRGLAAEFDRRMLARGRAAWNTPAVLPLSTWLPEVFSDCGLRAGARLPRILTAEQEEQIWSAVIRQEGGALQPALLRVEATARRAREAYALLCEWRLDLADRRFGDSEDAEAFRRWALRFRALLAERGQAVAAQIPALLRPLLAQGVGPLPPRMLLAGFYELTPAQQALLAALRGAGCQADWVALRGTEGRAARLRADDARHEMRLAAGWARRILEQRPEAQIGIVAPDLAARRSALASTLGKTLDPAALAPGAPMAPRPWNISLGQPLRDHPLVATALRLLALTRQPVDTELLGTLLLSPHWALPREPAERRAELDRRALLDRRIRALGDARMRLSNLWYQAGGRADGDEGETRPWHSALLAARLAALLEAARELPARADCADWAAAFSGWLKAAGWSGPGGDVDNGVGSGNRPLDSHEFQAVDAWNALLSRFSGLSDFAGTPGVGEALALLGRLAGETLFQPRSGDAPVQVLGLYEATGQSFEHLWVMGLHDGVWPPASAPDPFIPLGLQRERRLPHSGPDIELAWAGEVTAALRASAAEVVFSHPGRDGNEALACSPLIAALPELAADAAANFLRDAPGDRWQQAMRESAAPETLAATARTPAPIALRNPEARGGSRLLADQAACPFRAFASHRLGAEPLERPQAGLDAMRKGALLHQVLERVWQALQSQSSLLAIQADELTDLVRASIGDVLEAQRRRSPATLTPRLGAVEAQRLEQRVLAWLELERQRSPFTVAACEQKRHFAAGGLRLGVRIDRIDRLEDGSLVVLDYKTGQVRPSAWFGERPEEPQLPLYGVVSRAVHAEVGDGEAGDAPVAAVAYALIRADGTGFSGVAREGGILPGLPPGRQGPLQEASETWPAVLDDWAAELERLAADFHQGEAAVDPKHGLQTCERHYCELGPLCRVRELLAGAEGAAEDDADD
jgi:probable DNA repair protein